MGNQETNVAPMTDVQKEILRFATRFGKLKHLDYKSFGVDYFFPLLNLIAQSLGENDDKFEELFDMVESEVSSDRELLESSRDVLLKLAALLDEAMVVSGFLLVEKSGMKDSGKLELLGKPGQELMQKYLGIGAEVASVVGNLVSAIEDIQDENEGEDEGEGDDEEEVLSASTAKTSVRSNSDSSEGQNSAVVGNISASGAASATSTIDAENTSPTPARSPDTVIDPPRGSNGIGG